MKRMIALILCCVTLTGLIAGCGYSEDAYVPTGDGLTWDEDYTGPTTPTTEPEEVQELSLVYYPNRSLNPYFCTDFTNKVLFSLIYQGLFTVDRAYNVEPVLCSRYSISDDMTTYKFYIDENATFSDGSKVTVQDVEASLKFAQTSQLYGGRFYRVAYIGVEEDGSLLIRMNTPYENLPMLLTVPILKADQLEEDYPLGTGPYTLSISATGARLNRRSNWWCSSNLCITAPIIGLVEAESTTQIRDEFQFGDVDLVQADTGSDHYADYLSDYELWDAESGIFLYMVCHNDSMVFSNDSVRSALTFAIDRDYLVKEYYRGFARSATLPASPQFPYYNQTLASKYAYKDGVLGKAVQEAGMTGWPVTMMVSSEDSLRLRVAQSIADMLEKAGLVVTIKTFTAQDASYILNTEEYDLLLGQTILSPNMDLSYFFAENTTLSRGELADAECYTLCKQTLENHGNYYSLHKTVMDNAYLCPILFRSYAIYATRGMLTELTPARDTVFYYSIGKTMEKAYIAT